KRDWSSDVCYSDLSCGSHGRTRFTKRQLIGTHHAQMPKPKVAHRARHRADVLRVARVHQPHAQPFKFAFSKQAFFGQGVSNLSKSMPTLSAKGALSRRAATI